ncbi:uncharacterized protein LOC129596315 [Paramacrobiotus metropolitanus]|uniref:uncharacterized protein LOC129596315 n=1 Tax=Paramacrobiotus metropolitanus TaxID=2943436 RepID=UPI002446358D|nr:uncharacterized protein LOC129596315 [Paramacrobiotus metropolitanus]
MGVPVNSALHSFRIPSHQIVVNRTEQPPQDVIIVEDDAENAIGSPSTGDSGSVIRATTVNGDEGINAGQSVSDGGIDAVNLSNHTVISAPIKVMMRVDSLPPSPEHPDLEAVREMMCQTVTGSHSSALSEAVFQWNTCDLETLVRVFIEFYSVHRDNLELGGRIKVRRNDACDLGGPYKELFTVLWEAFRSFKLDELGSTVFEEAGCKVLFTGSVVMSDEGKNLLRCMGFALREAILRYAPSPVWLNNSIFRALLGLPVELNDIQDFKKSVGEMISHILMGSGDIVITQVPFLVDWSELNPSFNISGMAKLGRETFCRYLAQYELVEKRAANVKYVLEGMLSGSMEREIRRLIPYWKDLEESFYWAVTSAHDLLSKIEPPNFGSGIWKFNKEIVFEWFENLVSNDLSCVERQHLLRFITASICAPRTPIRIEFSAELDENWLPTACTCFNRLTLPTGCSSQEKLLAGIRQCIASVAVVSVEQGSFQFN